jgi:hypothetical protein
VKDFFIPFEHRQTAHCESGAASALLRHQGLDVSEPMVFGTAAAMTFAYVPFIKMGGLPLFAYRMPPGAVLKGLAKRLGVRMRYHRYRDPDEGMRDLDAHLAAGRVVGLQTSVYWLEYFPPDMRFHFNAHNLLVYGKRGDRYLVSDPVIDIPVECSAESLKRARFVRGVLAPKGLLYYPETVPQHPDWPRAIRSSLRFTVGMMLHAPLPVIGVKGIRYVARRIRAFKPSQAKQNRLYLGHLVRMQEEIGTGGAGFRFLFAAFLQESAERLGEAGLAQAAESLTQAGDEWRRFAMEAARMCKGRDDLETELLAKHLERIADMEAEVYRGLKPWAYARG